MSKGPPPEGYDDNPEWTVEDFKRARSASEVLPPEVLAAFGKPRGRPKGSTQAKTKQQVTLRVDRDVLDRYRATGPGWQSRINDALRAAAPQ